MFIIICQKQPGNNDGGEKRISNSDSNTSRFIINLFFLVVLTFTLYNKAQDAGGFDHSQSEQAFTHIIKPVFPGLLSFFPLCSQTAAHSCSCTSTPAQRRRARKSWGHIQHSFRMSHSCFLDLKFQTAPVNTREKVLDVFQCGHKPGPYMAAKFFASDLWSVNTA